MVAEFESDLIRLRTREGMKVAKAKRRLRGKQPKLNRRQEAHLVSLVHSGEYSTLEVAELFGLGDERHVPARQLPQGDKKLLDVASAFALKPEIILLDEPTSGVSTADKTAIMDTLVAASKRVGLKAIVQVEHDMDIVFGYSDRIVALHQGKVLADAAPTVIRSDQRVMDTVVGRKAGVSRTSAC